MTVLTQALASGVVRTGLLLPESLLHSDAVKVLATFVALNTLMYATLATVKILPRVPRPRWLTGANRRSQDRSIHVALPSDVEPETAADHAHGTTEDRPRLPSHRGPRLGP